MKGTGLYIVKRGSDLTTSLFSIYFSYLIVFLPSYFHDECFIFSHASYLIIPFISFEICVTFTVCVC